MLDSKVLEARKNLLVVSCPHRFDENICEYTRKNLTPTDLLNLDDYLKSFKKEFPDTGFMALRQMASWLADDRIDRTLKKSEFNETPEYRQYVKTREKYLRSSLSKSKKDHVFIRGNPQILAALKAMVTHDGYLHLIGNMLIFILFSVFLEQRIGSFGLILLYSLGGLGSNFLQLPFLPMGVRLFGASGAVSAVIGAFAVYFWREKMRCWLSLGFIYNRTIFMSAWLYIGLFMLLSDVIGLVGAEDGVAHLAHLTGFLIGFIFAFMQMDLFPLKQGFLFGQEQKLYYLAKETGELEEKMALYRRIFSLNKESYYAFRGLFLYFNKEGIPLSSFAEEDVALLGNLIRDCLKYEEKGEKYFLVREILSFLPLTWDLSTFELKVGPNTLIETAERFRQEGNLVHCLRFYDMFFIEYTAHARTQEVQSEIMKIFDEVENYEPEIKEQLLETLMSYADHHPRNHFTTHLRHLSHRVHQGDKRAVG